jgi:hypothetical protein
MRKYTLKPWQAPQKLKSSWGVYAADGTPVAKTAREADASLIAAAPELLNALQALLNWIPIYPESADGIVGGRSSHQRAIEDARAAIAKATREAA